MPKAGMWKLVSLVRFIFFQVVCLKRVLTVLVCGLRGGVFTWIVMYQKHTSTSSSFLMNSNTNDFNNACVREQIIWIGCSLEVLTDTIDCKVALYLVQVSLFKFVFCFSVSSANLVHWQSFFFFSARVLFILVFIYFCVWDFVWNSVQLIGPSEKNHWLLDCGQAPQWHVVFGHQITYCIQAPQWHLFRQHNDMLYLGTKWHFAFRHHNDIWSGTTMTCCV